ncbi:DUF2127 domain-containing protein [Pyxidicoccus parkwayensis]|uniref:DUF2127 domain-containing protein n=1 Tax=Pyxidicoccus parkwayensis TaxID=2813578 RepID=A0ABX7NZV7_9BACT|nr:DUF2127 domain-containing protein [Pyxidicoccus parkwaysis]QSQ22954.1 DUF2127 domain-containing protein [Pyxidicoccus parkwaysis]
MSAPSTPEKAAKPLGLRLIIAYKVAKAVLVLGLAVLLTLAPRTADTFTEHLIQSFSERGSLLRRIGERLRAHGVEALVTDARTVAWADGFSTSIEAALLLTGSAWGEWIVIAELAVLVPAELVSLERRPSLMKGVIIAVNVAIVAYLVRLRLRARRHETRPRGARP